MLGQFSAMAYGVIDTVMTGHASPADLAAMGLGAAVYGTVFVGSGVTEPRRDGADVGCSVMSSIMVGHRVLTRNVRLVPKADQ